MLHLHQVPEGDGIQGESEEVPLARPQQVERSEGEEGKGMSEEHWKTISIFKSRLCCLLSLEMFAHIFTRSRLLYKTGFRVEPLSHCNDFNPIKDPSHIERGDSPPTSYKIQTKYLGNDQPKIVFDVDDAVHNRSRVLLQSCQVTPTTYCCW